MSVHVVRLTIRLYLELLGEVPMEHAIVNRCLAFGHEPNPPFCFLGGDEVCPYRGSAEDTLLSETPSIGIRDYELRGVDQLTPDLLPIRGPQGEVDSCVSQYIS